MVGHDQWVRIWEYVHKPKHIPKTFTQSVKREGWMANIWSSISHVPSSIPKWFHCTLTWSIKENEHLSLQHTPRFWMEFSIWIHLQYKPTIHMINIFNIPLRKCHMEKIMGFQCWRQCKSIGYWSNPFKNIERYTKLRYHIGTWSNPQGSVLHLDTQVYLFPNLKLLKQPIPICINFEHFLCYLWILLDYLHFLFHLCQHI